MPDNLNSGSISPRPEPDIYELEIDELWQAILADFSNHSLHQRLLFLTARYILFDRTARYYTTYLDEHPDDGTALKFRDELMFLTTSTLLRRQTNVSSAPGRSTMSKSILSILGILILVVALVFTLHVSKLRENIIAKTYENALLALARGDLEKARGLFNSVRDMNPHYRDTTARLEDVLRSLKMKQEQQQMVFPSKKLQDQTGNPTRTATPNQSHPSVLPTQTAIPTPPVLPTQTAIPTRLVQPTPSVLPVLEEQAVQPGTLIDTVHQLQNKDNQHEPDISSGTTH